MVGSPESPSQGFTPPWSNIPQDLWSPEREASPASMPKKKRDFWLIGSYILHVFTESVMSQTVLSARD